MYPRASARQRVFRALEVGLAGTGTIRWVHAFVILLILANVAAVMLESYPPFAQAYGRAFWWFELFSVAIFTIEYVARLWCIVEAPRYRGLSPAAARLRYALSPLSLIDLAAILPFYLSLGIDLRSIRVVRFLRLFQMLKLARYSQAVKRIHKALMIAREELLLFGAVALILLYLSAVGIYYFEHSAQPDAFQSVFHSLWWAVATLTTVGYGDVYPITAGGRVFTFFILMLGLGIVAVPAGLLASALSKARMDEEKARNNDQCKE